MVGWHHRLNGHGFGWTPGVGDGQGGLVCCGSWGRKELNMTGWLNWNELSSIWAQVLICDSCIHPQMQALLESALRSCTYIWTILSSTIDFSDLPLKWSESHSVMSNSLWPMDCSPPGSSVHGILQARILEWVATSSQGDLPNPGIKPRSPALQADSLPTEPPGKPGSPLSSSHYSNSSLACYPKL